MKSLQTISSIVFLMLTIPTLLFLSSREIEAEGQETELIDSIDLKLQTEDAALYEHTEVIQAGILSPLIRKVIPQDSSR